MMRHSGLWICRRLFFEACVAAWYWRCGHGPFNANLTALTPNPGEESSSIRLLLGAGVQGLKSMTYDLHWGACGIPLTVDIADMPLENTAAASPLLPQASAIFKHLHTRR